MKKYPALVFFFFFILLISCNQKKMKPPFVYDGAGILSKKEKDVLLKKIQGIEKRTLSEMCIYITDSIPSNVSVENFAKSLFNRLQIGKKGLSNGVLIFLSLKERAFRIEIGYGFEWIIEKNELNDIVKSAIFSFSKSNFFDGIIGTIESINYLQNGHSWAVCDDEYAAQYNNETCVRKIRIINASLSDSSITVQIDGSSNQNLNVKITPYMNEIASDIVTSKRREIFVRMISDKEAKFIGVSED